METCSASLALCEGNPPVTVGFPSQRPVTLGFDDFVDLPRTNGWANNRDAGDLIFKLVAVGCSPRTIEWRASGPRHATRWHILLRKHHIFGSLNVCVVLRPEGNCFRRQFNNFEISIIKINDITTYLHNGNHNATFILKQDQVSGTVPWAKISNTKFRMCFPPHVLWFIFRSNMRLSRWTDWLDTSSRGCCNRTPCCYPRGSRLEPPSCVTKVGETVAKPKLIMMTAAILVTQVYQYITMTCVVRAIMTIVLVQHWGSWGAV